VSIRRYIKPLVIAAVLLGAGVFGYWTLYEKPRREIMESLSAQLRLNQTLDGSTRERARVRQELREIGGTTLGIAPDRVDAQFRAALQRIADSCRLGGVQISTKQPEDVRNPIATLRRRPSDMPDMSRQVDFRIVRGELTAHGPLEQVLRATALIQNQPWVHRVDTFSISPPTGEGREQERYTLRIGVATIMLDGELAPRESREPEIAMLPADAPLAWASIVQKNPFREPRRVAENPRRQETRAAAPPPPPPPPPAPPPYNEWRLAGVVESRLGTEAFLVNIRSDERMAIGTGASVAGARLVAAEGERAIFEIEGEEFEIFNGQTFEQRRPANR
jgi:hypothetical protein